MFKAEKAGLKGASAIETGGSVRFFSSWGGRFWLNRHVSQVDVRWPAGNALVQGRSRKERRKNGVRKSGVRFACQRSVIGMDVAKTLGSGFES